jgi:hypothetical protein
MISKKDLDDNQDNSFSQKSQSDKHRKELRDQAENKFYGDQMVMFGIEQEVPEMEGRKASGK